MFFLHILTMRARHSWGFSEVCMKFQEAGNYYFLELVLYPVT